MKKLLFILITIPLLFNSGCSKEDEVTTPVASELDSDLFGIWERINTSSSGTSYYFSFESNGKSAFWNDSNSLNEIYDWYVQGGYVFLTQTSGSGSEIYSYSVSGNSLLLAGIDYTKQ